MEKTKLDAVDLTIVLDTLIDSLSVSGDYLFRKYTVGGRQKVINKICKILSETSVENAD